MDALNLRRTAPGATNGWETAVRLRDVSFSHHAGGADDRPLFDGLDLDVRRGELVAFLGSSGVGKSTLLRLMAGLLQPTKGTVEVDVEAAPLSRAAALVFQDPRLMPWRTLRANVALGLEGLGLDRKARERRVDEALETVGLKDLGERHPSRLSGGQRQRGGLARALAVRPGVLLMDEPFSALDPATRSSLRSLLIEVWRATATTTVLVTHDIVEAMELADRIIVLAGRPVRAAMTITLDDPRPRDLGSPRLERITRDIRAVLDLHNQLSPTSANGSSPSS